MNMANSADRQVDASELLPRSPKEIELERLRKFPSAPDEPEEEDRTSGVLLSDRIERLCNKYKMIHPLNKEHLKPASYELSVGDLFSRSGETFPLKPRESFAIEPFDVVLIQTLETLNLPPFLIARWNIRIKWAYRGLLWVGAPQVDPGFRGFLSCPIYNLSNKAVTLSHGEPIAAMDFVMTTPFVTGKSLHYEWDKRTRLLFTDYEKDKLESALLTEAANKLKAMEGKTGQLENGLSQTRETVTTIQQQVTTEIAEITANLTTTTEVTRQRIDTNVSNIQNRIDSYTARTLTVLAVLFAALGLAVSRSPEMSYLSSATPLAALALWFALRSFYSSGAQPNGPGGRSGKWFEIALGILLAVALLTIQYKVSERYRSDWTTTRDTALAAQRDVRDLQQDLANRQEVQRRLDSLEQRIDALKSPKR
jgi:deoxycytidine triphosphate deaminase